MFRENASCAATSTGRCFARGVGGYWLRHRCPFQFFAGRMGRAEKPPPQFGHTLPSTFSTHGRQNVHSNVQIMAAAALGGRAALQFSQVGRSSSMSLPDEDVRGALARDGFFHFITERAQVEAVEKFLTLPEEDGPHGEVHVVDQALL